MGLRSNFLRSFFRPKFAFHLRIKSSRPSMHRISPVRDRLISDSRRALQFCGDSRPRSLLITRGDITGRCAILSRSYRIKSSSRHAIGAIRSTLFSASFSSRPTSTANLENQPCNFVARATLLSHKFIFREMPEADRS